MWEYCFVRIISLLDVFQLLCLLKRLKPKPWFVQSFFRIPAWKHLGSFDGDLAKVKYYSLQLITLYYWEKDGKRIDPIWSNIININQAGSRWYFILGGMDYPLNLDVSTWKIGLEGMSRSLDQGFYSFGCGCSHLLEQKACSEWFCAHPSGMKEHSPNLWLRWDLPLR